MHRAAWLNLLQHHRVIAVIRAPQIETGIRMAQAVAQGGIRLIEVTWDSQQPHDLLKELRVVLPDCWIGAGTLLSATDLTAAIAAGSQFGFSPHTDPDLLARARHATFPLVAGALTPTEILTAWRLGSAGVKVFPISTMGGPAYLHNLRGPLSDIPMIPTGGVTVENACSLLQAGAVAVGLSGSLFPKACLQSEDWSAICDRAHHLVQSIRHRNPPPVEWPSPPSNCPT